jgi:8-oxo-dGTP pyrophosphatase MutT (NUDIX family)
MKTVIKPISNIVLTELDVRYTSCIVLTEKNQILLQQRGKACYTYPGYISTFGGEVEKNEAPLNAIVRELKEELGAHVLAEEIVFLAAYTEQITNHQDIIFGYFWHDKEGRITGCYEEEALYFSRIEDVFLKKPLMDDVRWLLMCSQQKQLLTCNTSCAVKAVFDSYPEHIRKQLLSIRALIFEVAQKVDGVGSIAETLKWGKPSYMTTETKSGSTIRMGWKQARPHQYEVYFNCKTTLVSTFKTTFGDLFQYGGNRSIILKEEEVIPFDELSRCITMALTYHLNKWNMK